MGMAHRAGPQDAFDKNVVDFPGNDKAANRKFEIEIDKVVAASRADKRIPGRNKLSVQAYIRMMAEDGSNRKIFRRLGYLVAWIGTPTAAKLTGTTEKTVLRARRIAEPLDYIRIIAPGAPGRKNSNLVSVQIPGSKHMSPEEEDICREMAENLSWRPAYICREEPVISVVATEDLLKRTPLKGDLPEGDLPDGLSQDFGSGPAYAGLHDSEDPGYGLRDHSDDQEIPESDHHHGAPLPDKQRDIQEAPIPVGPSPAGAAVNAPDAPPPPSPTGRSSQWRPDYNYPGGGYWTDGDNYWDGYEWCDCDGNPTVASQSVRLVVRCACGGNDDLARNLPINEPARSQKLERWDCVATDDPCEHCDCIGCRTLRVLDAATEKTLYSVGAKNWDGISRIPADEQPTLAPAQPYPDRDDDEMVIDEMPDDYADDDTPPRPTEPVRRRVDCPCGHRIDHQTALDIDEPYRTQHLNRWSDAVGTEPCPGCRRVGFMCLLVNDAAGNLIRAEPAKYRDDPTFDPADVVTEAEIAEARRANREARLITTPAQPAARAASHGQPDDEDLDELVLLCGGGSLR